ncbi:hypothetical protein Y032_0046g1417 [Ancylostoma ceylanicum]|uniref:SCP domain-containing protein n=1 Tax=Ancylostoma ceylanicum TaxID=53326 RepID=A0A016UCW2_9BILA|nr:hypothetical protein Y032_0046g1417 [Ancylostoma ceylanicum]
MISVLLLQLVTFYLIHLTQAGPLAAPDVQIPNCNDGMHPRARELLVKGVMSKNPKLKYACHLSEGFAFSDAYPPNYLYYDGRKHDYSKARDFVLGAVEEWEATLREMKSRERFVCTLSTNKKYLLVCVFE